ncbi:MAG: hypothetical protein NC907_04480 [Candidatus Omnitrophica bacterium]|nr:hypothetical protein [Candidatus Omnitrophota bacterium]
MAAGTLSGAGYFMGERMMPPTPGNPKGYFEAFDIESINEELLAQVTPSRPQGILRFLFRHRPTRSQRWLAQVSPEIAIPCPPKIKAKIQKLTSVQPYCFKDPRFCYTLPAWVPMLNNTVFICVFRHPSDTAISILKECQREPYLSNLSINFRGAIHVWSLMYTHILTKHKSHGKWLFLHFNQILTKSGIYSMENFIQAEVNKNFPDPNLRRSRSDFSPGKTADKIYQELCMMANYRDI